MEMKLLKETENMNRLNDFLVSKYDLPRIRTSELIICFCSAKKSSDLGIVSNKAYAVIGDKYLDAILLDYMYKVEGYLSEEQLNHRREVFTGNEMHKDIMIKSRLADFVMNGDGETLTQVRTVKKTLSAVYESFIYVIHKELGETALLSLIKKIYNF